jgi:hypothetical protein
MGKKNIAGQEMEVRKGTEPRNDKGCKYREVTLLELKLANYQCPNVGNQMSHGRLDN